MRFESLVGRWDRGDITQVEAAEMLGVSVRTFQRWSDRFEEAGSEGLADRRLGRPSPRRAPAEELERMLGLFKDKYSDFTVKHFHEQLVQRHGYVLGYTVTKLALHAAGMVRRAPGRSKHRKKRPRRPLRGMLLHQDGSRHAWLEGQPGLDLIVTMDDATSEILSMFLVAEEGTASTFQALREVVGEHGLFLALYTDRGSHYFETPKAGEKVSKTQLTQVGRALKQLGIEHIAAYSPEARGRSERLFRTLQDRLPKEWPASGRSRRPTPGSKRITWPSTTGCLRLLRRRMAALSSPIGRGHGATSCASSRTGWWATTTRLRGAAGGCSCHKAGCARTSSEPRCGCASTPMGRSLSIWAPTGWRATPARASPSSLPRPHPVWQRARRRQGVAWKRPSQARGRRHGQP